MMRPRHWRSVPAHAWPRRGGPSYAGKPAPRQAQRSAIGQVSQRGLARGADQRPQLHGADRPGGGGRGIVGEQRRRHVALGARDRGRRELHARDGPHQDPPDVGVEDDVPLAEGEAGDGRGGVVAHARQREQVVVRRRDLAAVALDDRDRGGVEAQRPTGVAQPAPHPHRLTGGLLGEGGRGRPPVEPGRVDRQHPGDRRLLEHELADHDGPRRGRHPAPRQLARVVVVPGEHGLVQGVGGHRGDTRTPSWSPGTRHAGC